MSSSSRVRWPQLRYTLGYDDRAAASQLKRALASPFNRLRVSLRKTDQWLTYDQRAGVWRGPRGRPLISIQLRNGIGAYVDPAGNCHYLSRDNAWSQPRLAAIGPLPLPKGLRFSPLSFSAAEAKALTHIANGHSLGPRPTTSTSPDIAAALRIDTAAAA